MLRSQVASVAMFACITASLACNDTTAPLKKKMIGPRFGSSCGNQERSSLYAGPVKTSGVEHGRTFDPSSARPSHGFNPDDECVSAEIQPEDAQWLEESPEAPTPDMDLWYGEDIAWPESGAGAE